MKEYGKWLIIGLILGSAISIGTHFTDYYINRYVFSEGREPPTFTKAYPEGVEVLSARVSETPFTYQPIIKIKNTTDIPYTIFTVTGELHDSEGLLEECSAIRFTYGKKEVLATLDCTISTKKHPSVEIKNIEVIQGNYKKTND